MATELMAWWIIGTTHLHGHRAGLPSGQCPARARVPPVWQDPKAGLCGICRRALYRRWHWTGEFANNLAIGRQQQEDAMSEGRPPVPPFTRESAVQKVQAAEDAWNSRDPQRVSLAYTADSQWRNRDLHIIGRGEIVAFLTRKWHRELDYVLRKSLWDFHDNRIAARFQYEWRDAAGQWYRSYGNELWEFTPKG
jgi:hypothetical protein